MSLLLFCEDFESPDWQLQKTPRADPPVALLGWKCEVQKQDGGIPDRFSALLSSALASVGQVIFFSSAPSTTRAGIWMPLETDSYALEFPASRLKSIAGKILGGPGSFRLIATRSADLIKAGFDDASYPWWLQGQIFLVSEKSLSPPDLSGHKPEQLLGEDWIESASNLSHAGVIAALKPGVDGDVAGLWTQNADVHRRLVAALKDQATALGVEVRSVPEPKFKEALAAHEC